MSITYFTTGSGGNQGVSTGTECQTGTVTLYNAEGGITTLAPPRPTAVLGGIAHHLPLMKGRSDTGLTLDATGAAGLFKIVNSTGTSRLLRTEGATNNTKTDKVGWEVRVPDYYKSGDSISVIVNAKYTLNGGTVGTHTIVADCYLIANAGTEGSNLNGTSATSITTSAADYTFAITGTSLTPGAMVWILVTAVIQETANAGTGTVIDINSVRLA